MATDMELEQAEARLHIVVAQRDTLLAALEAILTFDFDTILAAAGGEPYSEHHDWNTVLKAARTVVAKPKGE